MREALKIGPPEPSEYEAYANAYISRVPGTDILKSLHELGHEAEQFYSGLSEEQGDLRYAPGKWSVREVLGHVIDTERIISYRVLRFSRNDQNPLPGFDQDPYVLYAPHSHRSLADLLEEFMCVRHSSLLLCRNLDQDAWMRRGVANNHAVTVRALAYIIAGHERHHRLILQEKYLAPKA